MSMDAVKQSFGSRDMTFAVVVMLKEGLWMNLFRGERSRITLSLFESFFGTLNNLAAKLREVSFLMTPAAVRSRIN